MSALHCGTSLTVPPGRASIPPMPTCRVNDLDLYYETSGSPDDPPLLLICGLGMQMSSWSDEFVVAMAAKGYLVITFDNRDAGLSTHFVESGTPDFTALFQGGDAKVAYLLSDMADDVAGLLDHLGLDSVHVLGISMGGMIAQQFAVDRPERVRSLTSIMSTTGNPLVGQPSPEAAGALLQLNATTRDEAMAMAEQLSDIIGSPGFPPDLERVRRLAGVAFDRSHEPTGIVRQAGALLVSPDRTGALGAVSVPTLVVHGTADVLIHPSGGEATAAAVPGAKLVMIEGLGHDLPVQIWDQLIDEVDALCSRAEKSRAADPASS